MLFSDLPIIEPILRAINEEGYKNPTPIQEKSIPTILKGRDFLWCAQTGTGKTASFAIPILQLLFEGKSEKNEKTFSKQKKIRTLIMTPTRELAIQIEESFRAYGRYTFFSDQDPMHKKRFVRESTHTGLDVQKNLLRWYEFVIDGWSVTWDRR